MNGKTHSLFVMMGLQMGPPYFACLLLALFLTGIMLTSYMWPSNLRNTFHMLALNSSDKISVLPTQITRRTHVFHLYNLADY